MNGRSRREFLADVGQGMLVATLGSTASLELGLSRAFADDSPQRLTFGTLEPLVSLMQETPPDKLMPLLVNKLNAGTNLKTLVTAAALANARAFGGQDYTGYHTFMVLGPAYQISAQLPSERRALPVLKVLYRNSSRIQDQGAHHQDTLHPVSPADSAGPRHGGELLRESVRAVDGKEPNPVSRRWPVAPPARPTITSNSPSKMKWTCIASCWLGARGSCWSFRARSMRTRCCGNQFATA